MLAVTSFEATNSVFNITDENTNFSITFSGHWKSDSDELNNKLNKILEHRSPNDIKLQRKEVEKWCTLKEIEKSEYNSAGFNHFKIEELAELKTVKYKNLEDMVYRLNSTYDGILGVLNEKVGVFQEI